MRSAALQTRPSGLSADSALRSTSTATVSSAYPLYWWTAPGEMVEQTPEGLVYHRVGRATVQPER